jgi:hypothetical protein
MTFTDVERVEELVAVNAEINVLERDVGVKRARRDHSFGRER